MKELLLLILAAGKGTRLKSSLPKVLHLLAGKPLIDYVLEASIPLHPTQTLIVIGHESETIKSQLADRSFSFIEQVPQQGTGQAVQLAVPQLRKHHGSVLILSGDVPLISASTLKRLIAVHQDNRDSLTLLSTLPEDPTGYGRVIRNSQGNVEKIIEEKDASPEERQVREINTGIYCFETVDLCDVISQLSSNNSQKEYYLTDCVGLLKEKNKTVGAVVCEDSTEVLGVNTRIDLARLERIVRERKLRQLMLEGVTIVDPDSTFVAPDVQVGRDTILYPNVFLEKGSTIGSGCQIYPNVRISHSVLEDNVLVLDCSVISESHVGDHAQIGPFAHLRPHSKIGKKARIGNFVEIKESEIGEGSKASHLSYLGDAQIGRGVNIGAGTITCNYDGVSKHRTVIEDRVFVGSDSQLIAPVTIHQGAYIAAGSSIDQEVPPDSLAIARSRQVIKENWSKKRVSRKE
jgi:bifunctional UDP-N-acetylglucosamine pyrophosphorylase / glucosamine-1-phosphate N-acetyltransferase